jgi:hypothetical protein
LASQSFQAQFQSQVAELRARTKFVDDRDLISSGGLIMKWTGMYLLGYVILIAGLLAALWKLHVLASVGTTWTLIGVVIAIGIGIMIAVSNSGSKENIEIDRK